MLKQTVWKQLQATLDELPETQRAVFKATTLQGFSAKELSIASGVPVATLLTRKHAAVLHLRKRLSSIYHQMLDY